MHVIDHCWDASISTWIIYAFSSMHVELCLQLSEYFIMFFSLVPHSCSSRDYWNPIYIFSCFRLTLHINFSSHFDNGNFSCKTHHPKIWRKPPWVTLKNETRTIHLENWTLNGNRRCETEQIGECWNFNLKTSHIFSYFISFLCLKDEHEAIWKFYYYKKRSFLCTLKV